MLFSSIISCSVFIYSDDKSVVPYLCTQNKNVRNEFRIFMGENPDKYDYSKAQVRVCLKQNKKNAITV